LKVLVSGALNPAFEAVPEYLTAALGVLGHRVTLFDHRAYRLPGRLRALLPSLEAMERRALNARLLAQARRLRPEAVIVIQGTVIDSGTLARLRDGGARLVNWFADYPAEFDAGLRNAPAYDAFYLGSSYAAARHRAAGHAHAAWLPFACDPERHRPVEAIEPGGAAADAVVFVGSHYPERQILLRFLRGLPVGIWGPGWERAAGDPHIAPMLRGGALRPAAWARLLSSCRVAINIHYGAFGPLEASGDLANTRVFEILACGVLQVVNRQGDVLRLFRDGIHLLGFNSGEELRARVEAALADDDLRRRVARAGRDEVLARHTYAHRAASLLGPAIAGFGDPAALRAAGGGAR
jgi:spore maturation protein CgeB